MERIRKQLDCNWIIHFIQTLIHEEFTGSIRINFHKGNISKKIEKTSYVSEK